MATQGEQAKWSDITALYTKLTTARNKFGFTPNNVTPASHQGQPTNLSDLSALNSFVASMSSHANLTTVAKGLNPMPAQGDLLRPSFLNTLSTTIDNIQAQNNFSNSSFNSSFNSNFNSSFNSGFNSRYNSSFGNSSWGACNDIADCWWY